MQTITWFVFKGLVFLGLTGILCGALFGANIDFFLPEFSNLDSKLSISIVYQLTLFVAFAVAIYYTLFKMPHAIMWLPVLVLFTGVILSTYTVTFSQRINSIATSFGLIPINELPFSDNLTIVKNNLGYDIKNQDEPDKLISIYTSLFLVNYSELEINKQLVELGLCRNPSEKICTKIDVSWP